MRLSSLADYAVIMMTAIAQHGDDSRLNAGLLSDKTGIPLPTVQKLVSKLAAAGLLSSVRGIGGGFELARTPADISLAAIVEAIDGPIALTACCDDERGCPRSDVCDVHPHWEAVNDAVRGAFAGVTLQTISVGRAAA